MSGYDVQRREGSDLGRSDGGAAGGVAGKRSPSSGGVVQRQSNVPVGAMMGAHPPPALHQDDPVVGPAPGAADDPFGVHLPVAAPAAPSGHSPAGGAAPPAGAWAASMSDIADLRQARLNVAAAAVGAAFQMGTQQVTMDDATRVQIQDAIRRRVMSCVVAARAPFQPQLAGAHDGPSRRAIQAQMRDAARPYLDELRDPAQPPNRFESDPVTQREVLAALELDGEGRAEAELEDQRQHGADGPRARARRAAHLPSGAWCGAFCYTQQHGAGLSEIARSALHATGPHRGVDAFLDYEHENRVVWSGTRWMPLREYHDLRGSLRRLQRTPNAPVPITPGSLTAPNGLDIQPGDVVLIDNLNGTFADHITQCRTYDPSTGQLETIGGNEGGGAGHVGASARPRDLNHNPAARTAQGFKNDSRVYAVGRFSIVDYETHHYLRALPADPTQSPEAMAAAQGGHA